MARPGSAQSKTARAVLRLIHGKNRKKQEAGRRAEAQQKEDQPAVGGYIHPDRGQAGFIIKRKVVEEQNARGQQREHGGACDEAKFWFHIKHSLSCVFKIRRCKVDGDIKTWGFSKRESPRLL